MKATYKDSPICMADPRTDELTLFADWDFDVDTKKIYVPMKYSANGASIPRVFWVLIGSPYDPDFWPAFMAHDYLYLTHLTTRAEADEIFYQFLLLSGVKKWKARCMWAAVRSCGGPAWKNDKHDKAELVKIRIWLALRSDGAKFGV